MSEMEKQDILELPSKTSAQMHNTDGMLGFNETDGGFQVTLENLAQYIAGDAKEFIPPTHGTAGQLLRSTGDGGSEWGDAASPEEIAEAVTDWLDENVPTGETLVVDESLTIEGAAAEAKVTGEKIEAAEGAIKDLRKEMFSAPIEYSGITTDSSWSTGSGVDSQTGGNMSDSDYCRTGFIKIESTTCIHLDSETYDFNVWEYTSNSTGSAIFAPKKAYNDKDAFVTFDQNATYFRIGARRKDLAHIQASDITALTGAIKTYVITDPTLSIAGASADAKVVGDNISELKDDLKYTTHSNIEFFEDELGITNYIFKYNDNKAIATSVDPVNLDEETLSKPSTFPWKYCIIPCTEGDKFHVTIGDANSTYRPWAFLKSDGAIISVATSNVQDRDLTAPALSAYLICNVRLTDSDTIYKVTKGENRITEVENTVFDIMNEISDYPSLERTVYGYLKGSFELGDWKSDIPKTKLNNRSYRVRSASQITYPYDIELVSEPGYYFYFHTYNGNAFKLANVFTHKPHYATIPANTEFDITISADPLDTSITADPETYRKAIRVYRRRFESYAYNWQPLQRNQVLISGHRGWMGNTEDYPENSIPSFEKAAQTGAWMIETDIQETSDGHFVCMHDSTVDRTTNGTGTVASKTIDEIKSLRLIGGDGTLTVPTFEEYLSICKAYNIVCHVEIKAVSNETTSIPEIIDIIRNYGLLHQTSYNPHTLSAGDIIRQCGIYYAPIHFLVETLDERWSTFDARMDALECLGSIRSGTDDLGNIPSAYREQIDEMHKRGLIVAHLSSSWTAQKEYLKVGFDYILSNNNLVKQNQ